MEGKEHDGYQEANDGKDDEACQTRHYFDPQPPTSVMHFTLSQAQNRTRLLATTLLSTSMCVDLSPRRLTTMMMTMMHIHHSLSTVTKTPAFGKKSISRHPFSVPSSPLPH